MSSMWVVNVYLPRNETERVDREEFFAWSWTHCQGLLGIHEGSLESEAAHELGFETESWVLDAGEAPQDRDWIGSLDEIRPQLYFSECRLAEDAIRSIQLEYGQIEVNGPVETEEADWNALWKASFQGIELHPDWEILPPWRDQPTLAGCRVLKINPGAGFGTGTHETTQLCLRFITQQANRLNGKQVLDFGSGSGILSIGAALLGAKKVVGVEVDSLAIDNASDNAQLNSVQDRVEWVKEIPESPFAQVAIANILRPILLEYSERLFRALAPDAYQVVLSGLVEADLPSVIDVFQRRLGSAWKLSVLAKNEWRALSFERVS